MEAMDYVSILSRWLHIGAGILWIGLLYFFNFVNGPFAATMDGETKKKVVPELMPRALYFFRWGAAYTWITGLLLLGLVYSMSHIFLVNPSDSSVTTTLLFWSFLIAPPLYDLLAKSALGKNPKVFAAICFVLTCGIIYLLEYCFGFSYRGTLMYVGAMFGTIMAYNVWMRIWPSQRKIINGIKTGPPADPSIVALAGSRSKHNTYMSVPLVWTMINMHSVAMAGQCNTLIMAGVILVGWGLTFLIYKKAAAVKGF